MKYTEDQLKTINSLKKINDNIYALHYQNNYGRDEIIKKGVVSLFSIYGSIQKYFKTNSPLINLFTPKGGCIGLSALTKNNEVLFSRNFDYKDTNCLILWIDSMEGYKSINMVDFNFLAYGKKHLKIEDSNKARLLAAPYVCMDGINEKELAVSIIEVKIDPSKQRRGKTRITPSFMLRLALDTCASVDEVTELFNNYDMHGILGNDYHFHVCDASGKSALYEYINNELKIIRNNEPEYFPKQYMYVPSFFIAKEGDNKNITVYAKERYDIAKEDMDKKDGIYSEKQLHELLKKCKTCHPHSWMPHTVVTVWSIIYNLSNLSATVCANNNFEDQYKINLDKPLEIEKL